MSDHDSVVIGCPRKNLRIGGMSQADFAHPDEIESRSAKQDAGKNRLVKVFIAQEAYH
jgi:hypothetical protein